MAHPKVNLSRPQRQTFWRLIFPVLDLQAREPNVGLGPLTPWGVYLQLQLSSHKESTCNAGDSGLVPGSGRSTGERASLVAQLVKNSPTMRETWVPSLGWEDSLEMGKATHSTILAWTIPWTVWSMLSDFHFHSLSPEVWVFTIAYVYSSYTTHCVSSFYL